MFAHWIKDRIAKFGFIEGQDYVCIESLSVPNSASSKARPQRTIEYFTTFDMAKELAMIERTPQGKAARQYFIDCEKELWRLVREENAPKPRDTVTTGLQGRQPLLEENTILLNPNVVCSDILQYKRG